MYERVLVGTDGSDTATRAVESAAEVAGLHGAELIIAHAFEPRIPAARQEAYRTAPEEVRWRLTPGGMADAVVEDAVERARAVAGTHLAVRTRCEAGHPVPVLLGLVDELDPDVVVVGNRDMRGPRLHRSIARNVSRRAACDVMIVDTIGRRQRPRDSNGLLIPRLGGTAG